MMLLTFVCNAAFSEESKDSLKGQWDILSESAGGQPVEPRYHKTWNITDSQLIINDTRKLFYKIIPGDGSQKKLQIFNKVGSGEISIYSCLYMLEDEGKTMKVAFDAGDSYPPGFDESASSYYFILRMKKRSK